MHHNTFQQRFTLKLLSTLLVVVVLVHLSFCTSYSLSDPADDRLREDAVQLARQGQVKKSIELLQGYHRDNPDDIALVSDLIVVLLWNGEHQKGVDLFRAYHPEDFPDYVIVSLLSSYRDKGLSREGLKFVENLPQEVVGHLGVTVKKIQLLIDTGEFKEADALLASALLQNPDDEDLLTVAGYFYKSDEDWISTLASYQKLLELYPDNKEALRGQTAVLLQLGAPFAAFNSIQKPEKADRTTRIAYLQGKAALLLRWSSYASKNSEESLLYARQSLQLLEKALNIVAADPDGTGRRRSIEYDLVVAYTNLQHFDEAYELYLKLQEEELPVPGYVKRAAAEALLGLKQPDDALSIMESIDQRRPRDYQTDLTHFYALIESEHFQEAYELLEKRLANTPKFKRFTDSQQQYRNDERLDLETVAAQARLYGDQLEEAWEKILSLRDRAPANDWLNYVAGETALARDWPRAAHTFFQTAYRLNPNNSNGFAGMAQADIRLHRLEAAEQKLAVLQMSSPEERVTTELAKNLRHAQMINLWADLELSYSEGPEQSGDGLKATTELISAPINHHLHINLQGRYAWSELLEGEESRTTYGGGLEYIREEFGALGLLQYNNSTLDEMGGLLRGSWNPDDHWFFFLQGELFSDATPLRALYYGIREDRVLGSATYRWHEGRSLYFSLSGGWFTDDNDRIEANTTFKERILDIPRFDLDLNLDLYVSKNSREDAPYYNPESDLSTKAGLSAEHIIYRLYDSSLTQKIYGNLGLYAQKNYSTGPTASLGYNLLYNHYPWIETVLGVEVGENRFDGEEEPYYTFTFLIHARF